MDFFQNICTIKNNSNQNWIKLNFNQTVLHIKNATTNNTGLYKCTIHPYDIKHLKTTIIEIQIQTFYVDIKSKYTIMHA